MLIVIANLLTALNQLLKQNHLVSENYQNHLLFERLGEGIDEDIDRVKEIALACGYSEDIANAQKSLATASEVLEEFSDIELLEKHIITKINQFIDELNNNETETLDGVFNEYTAKQAVCNMLGDIAEKRTRDLYLLRFGDKK